MSTPHARVGIPATLLLLIGLVQYATAPAAPADSASASSSTTPADNTRANKLDAANGTDTADSQPEDARDRATIQRIRKRLMADQSLSTYAHNVKILSMNGTVTLNGVVRSDREKARVAAKAAAVAGKSHVVNDLKVAPPNS